MLEKSKGDIVGYFDADMILSPNFLSSKLTFENNAKKIFKLFIYQKLF